MSNKTETQSKDPVTPVIFKKHAGTVVAVFPTLLGTYDPATMLSYVHVGQHSACDQAWVSCAKRAKPEEYAELLDELVNLVGYDNLKIVRKQTDAHRKIREAELKAIGS